MTSIERLLALEHFGIKLGLDAMRVLLGALGDPHLRWPSVHVAGTNGKGSVSAMAERALRDAGLRTGRYTSPHLVRIEERIAVSGHEISRRDFTDALDRTFATVDRLVGDGALAATPTFFEVSTAAAFLHFADQTVDVAVVEVGLGGRYDATNVVHPAVCAITTIDFDHERHLGSTLTAIAREKAGIAKAGVPLVVGDVPAEAWRAIDAAARAAGAPLVRATEGTTVEAPLVDGHARLTVETPRGRYGPVRLALGGSHQASNAVVAIRLLEAWSDASGRQVSRAAVEAGLAHARWAARLEWLKAPGGRTTVLVDAAHNPSGARALASYLAMAQVPPVTLVTSVMGDKRVPDVLGPLLPHVARVIVTEAATPRAMPAAQVAAIVGSLARPGTPISVERDSRLALAAARRFDAPVLLAGSIFLVGPLRAALVDEGFEST
ncbi:MAG: folylpolyglutamate synthase/dihydrofolate synthase family protein [Vicinamibacterales bacterium]